MVPSPPLNPLFPVWNPAEADGSLDISSSKVRISPWVFIFFKHSQPAALSNFSRSQVQHFPLHYLCLSSMNSLQIKMLGAQNAHCWFRCCLSSMETLFFFLSASLSYLLFCFFSPLFCWRITLHFHAINKDGQKYQAWQWPPNGIHQLCQLSTLLVAFLLFLPSTSYPSWTISIQANLNSSCVIWGDTKLEASSW